MLAVEPDLLLFVDKEATKTVKKRTHFLPREKLPDRWVKDYQENVSNNFLKVH